jgi:hypothetical protein
MYTLAVHAITGHFMDKQQIAENRVTVIGQLEAIASYLNRFEVMTQKDEAAFNNLCNMVMGLTQHVQEMDSAQKKRIQLMNELANAYNELEESHKKFADKVKAKSA